MKALHITSLAILAAAMIPNASGQAPFDVWSFRGVLTTGFAEGPIQAGQPYSMEFSLDTTRLSPSATGFYYPTVGYGFSVGNYRLGASSLGSGVLVVNDQPSSSGGSLDGIVFGLLNQVEGFPEIALDGLADGITLVANSSGNSPFSDKTFPSGLDLKQFSQRDLTLNYVSGIVRGSVESLYINGALISQVPEPNWGSLFALGALGLIFPFLRGGKS